jgi:hypothetical protein
VFLDRQQEARPLEGGDVGLAEPPRRHHLVGPVVEPVQEGRKVVE